MNSIDEKGYKTKSDWRDEFLKQMVKTMMEKLMQQERTDFLGYESGESLEPGSRRDNHRNGYRLRDLVTSLGLIEELQIPRDRLGEFYPKLLTRYTQRSGKVNELILALYGKGMSERDITDIIERIYEKSLSAQTISNLVSTVGEEREAWAKRPLKKRYVAIFVDALHVKIRREVVDSDAVYLVYGIDEDGHREVLGLYVGVHESAVVWSEVFADLSDRGVEQILIVVMDGLSGLKSVVHKVFPGALVQHCVVHQVRKTLARTRVKHKAEMAQDLKTIYRVETIDQARENLSLVRDKWKSIYPRLFVSWENNFPYLTTFLKIPVFMRRYVYTTNWLERLNKELRKVVKTKNSFPTPEAVSNLLYLKIVELNQKWEARKLAGFDAHRVELEEFWEERYPRKAVTHSG